MLSSRFLSSAVAAIVALTAAGCSSTDGVDGLSGAASGGGASGGSSVGAGGDGGYFDPGTSGACAEAIANKQSVGCDYYATHMDSYAHADACFAAFIANAGETAAHIAVTFENQELPIAEFARIPTGSGPTLSYGPFDPDAGVPPGEVVILFLSGLTGESGFGNSPCPVPSAVPSGTEPLDELGQGRTGIGKSFHITSDTPVVAYQINPYGGGSAAVTGASLLLPTSAWDTTYVAANAYGYADYGGLPSMNIVAMADDTVVTLVPVADVEGGGGVPAGPAGVPLSFELQRGEQAQLSQYGELTGSIVQASAPVGLMAGHQCMVIPTDATGPCDHGEQMLPPAHALGSEYVGVMYQPRTDEPAIWRVIGAVDGTELSWSSAVGGPASLARGQAVELITAEPFVVHSQDDEHPFILFQHMSSNAWMPYGMLYVGDPDSVLGVPPAQYMREYVFFADPTYPTTNLVVVRAKQDGAFADVVLDCAGPLEGWQPVGDYEWTRTDLNDGLFGPVGACDTGRHEITSDAPFGLWVWGWGNPDTEDVPGGVKTISVSYGYPAGMNVESINDVRVPVPK